MVPGFHGLDLLVILVVALLIFGPKRLPEMGASIGKSIKEFRKGMNELTQDKEEKEKAAEAKAAEARAAEVKEVPMSMPVVEERTYEGRYYPQESGANRTDSTPNHVE